MNIILIGFMGSGKSTIAHLLSKMLEFSHIETDELVLSRSQRKSITDIFALDGETRFRELEIAVAKSLISKKNTVISTGGGMVLNKICIDYLKENGTVIYLNTSFSEIEARLQGDDTRPLFRNRLNAQKLFQFRKALYSQYAQITVKTDSLSIDNIIKIILKKI